MEKSFNCKKCNKYVEPKKDQYIFYHLCDDCFTQFDTQKMAGIFLGRNIGNEITDYTGLWHGFKSLKPPFFENVNDWIKSE